MEIITLQFGHYANYAGAHFWNFQDELAGLEANTDTEGVCHDDWDNCAKLDFNRFLAQSEAYGSFLWKPRLVAVDKKGALGAFGGGGVTVEPMHIKGDKTDLLWDHGVADHAFDVLQRHPFQLDLEREELGYDQSSGVNVQDEDGNTHESDQMQIDCQSSTLRSAAEYNFSETVHTWTDYLKMRIPSSCVHELHGWHHGVDPFATYFDGLEMKGRDEEDMILDLIRQQMENCDQLDAVNVISEAYTGFSGLASNVLHWIKEEQPKCGRLVLSTQPELPNEEGSDEMESDLTSPSALNGPVLNQQDAEERAWVSAAFSFASVVEAGAHTWSPVVVPLWSLAGPPALRDLRRTSMYETSALIATALDTLTLPYRLRGGLRPSEFLHSAAPPHRPTCGIVQALPLPIIAGRTAALSKLAPGNIHQAFFDLSGIPPMLQNPYTSVVARGLDPRCVLQLCDGLPQQALRQSFVHPSALPLPVPFPQFFGSEVSTRGFINAGDSGIVSRPADAEVEVCPVATKLHAAACSGKCAALKQMRQSVAARRRSAFAGILRDRYSVEADDFSDVLEVVTDHLECGAPDSDVDDD